MQFVQRLQLRVFSFVTIFRENFSAEAVRFDLPYATARFFCYMYYLYSELPQMMVCVFVDQSANLFFRHFTKKIVDEHWVV